MRRAPLESIHGESLTDSRNKFNEKYKSRSKCFIKYLQKKGNGLVNHPEKFKEGNRRDLLETTDNNRHSRIDQKA